MTSFPPFRLDAGNQCLWRGDLRVDLMPKPFAVLQYLVEHAGQLVTQDQLLSAIWPDTYVQPEVVRRYILEIRRALGDEAEAPRFVQTLPRRGYRFIAPIIDHSGTGPLPRMTRLVGRESALADLTRYLGMTLSGRRQLLFVVGEPGIGKTSLVDAFHTSAVISGATVVRGQAVEGFGGKEPYYPLLEAVGQLARGSARTLVVETLGSHAPTWLVQFPSLVTLEQHAALQRQILGATRERMVRELCEALEMITQIIPVVLILEDLHWVDHPTLDVISLLARRRERAKLLLVGTLRQADLILSESPLKPLKQDLLLHRLSHELELERLQESDVANYVAAEFSPGELPPELASVIYRHSDGNPLFMVAMLDHLARTGVLSRARGPWMLTRPIEQIDPGVPETLKQMLDIQLEHASDAEQRLLKAASVAGEQFTVWALGAMLPGEAVDLEDTCETLVGRQRFLKFAGTRELSADVETAEYRFAHALYREALYRKLSPTQRMTFHQRLADGLEHLRPTVAPETAAELALHFEAGQQFERAIRYLMLAAESATRRYAHQQAIARLEHAYDLLAKMPPHQTRSIELEILERIGNAYYALGQLDQSARTYEQMAVRAADAGLIAAQGDTLIRFAHQAEAVPFFMKAIELEPNFVAGYTALSRIYSNLGEIERAKTYARLAYERRDLAGERERLSIAYQYHFEVTGDQARAGETLETWKRDFPLEFQPANALAVMHNFLGDFEHGIAEGQEALRRNPSHGYPYSNLAHAYRGIGRFEDAHNTAQRAVELEIETLPTRRLLYQLAVLRGEHQRAAQHLEWARDKPREFDMIGAHAQVVAWEGKVRAARRLYDEAARMAERRNLPEVGNSHLAWAITMEVAYGHRAAACDLARRVLAHRPSYDSCLRAAVALAGSEHADEAEAIAAELARANPEHTLINLVLVPIVRAAIELRRRRPVRALDHLRIAEPYELGVIAALAPIYLRGDAHLMLGAADDATAQFQRILDHRGSDPFSPFHALAPLGLARARALACDPRASLNAYEQFLGQWTDADPDVPVLLEAQREYVRLKRSAAG